MAGGETTLAAQLRQLQTPQTALLEAARAGSERVSLLFDTKEAATLDRDTVYAIGCSGLEELCKLNRKAFGRFEKTLFSDTSKDLQRAVQTKEKNEQLDATLTDFLYRLSPYLLLRPAHKALEWLVYRFQVHEFNTAALVQAALPFHESNIFARILQLLNLSDESTCWHFMASNKAQGTAVTKRALVAQCAKSPGLFRFVCDLLPAMRRSNQGAALRPAINLTTGVMLGVVELHGSRIDNKLVSAIVAHIADSLMQAKQDGHAEWVSANVVVLAQLARKQPALKGDLLQLLLITMVKSLTDENINSGIYALLITYRYQTTLDTLPQKVVKGLLAFADMAERLKAIVTGRRHGEKFLRLFMHGLFVHSLMNLACTEAGDAVLPYLSFLGETAAQKQMVVEQFMSAYFLVRVSTAENKCIPAASAILRHLKQRAGDELDAEIVKAFQTADRELAAELVSECSLGIQHTPASDTGETIYLALISKLSHVRLSAVTAIVEKSSSIDADDFVKKSLMNLISTETDPGVYSALLQSLTAEKLLKFVNADEVAEAITERVCNFRKKKWTQINEQLVKLVCDGLGSHLSGGSLLRFLLTMATALRSLDVALLNECLKSSVAHTRPELKYFVKCKVSEDTPAVEICNSVTAALARGFSGTPVDDCIQSLLDSSEANLRLRYASLLFAEHLVGQSKPLGLGVLNRILDKLQAAIPDLTEADDDMSALLGGVLPVGAVTRVICALLQNMQPIKELETVPSWHRSVDARSSEIAFLRRVFAIAVERQKKEKSFRAILSRLFSTCLPSAQSRCNFLSDMLLGHLAGPQSDDDIRLLTHSLCLLAHFIGDVAENARSLITVSIVCVLLSPSRRVRRLAAAVLEYCSGDSCIDYLVKHSSSTGDVDTVLKCIATFHKSHKQTFLNQMLTNEHLTPLVRLGVLQLLASVTSVSTVDACMEVVQRYYIDNPALTIDSVNREIIQLCLQKLSVGVAKKLSDAQQAVLFGVLRSSNETLGVLALQCLSAELFVKLSERDLVEILDHLLTSLLDPQSDSHRAAAETALGIVCQTAPTLIVAELAKVTVDDLAKLQSVRDVKRMRLSLRESSRQDGKTTATTTSVSTDNDPLETTEWRRALILLECLHGVELSLERQSAEVVLSALYDVLRRSLELPATSVNVEYVKQCVLSCLQVHSAGSDEFLRPHRHQISLLVKALRLSQSAQTQHAILAMLNHMARLYPDEVLQNMTSVFTFMGTSLLRQEDEYSFQVVVQTIQSVIPILLEASKSRSNSDVVSKVTRVFIDSWPDIPEHRRYSIFRKLIETLGPADYAWTLVAQMVDRLLDKEADLEECDFLEFMLGLLGDMSLDTILCSCHRLLKFALSVPLSQKQSNRSSIDKEIVNPSQCSDQRLADFKSVSAMFVEQVLSGTNFLSLAAELADSDVVEAENLYRELIAVGLESIHVLNAAIQERTGDDLLESLKTNISLLHDCVDRVNGVLRPDTLVSVVENLLAEKLPSIRRNAMDMLNNKLIAETFFDGCDKIADLVEPLCAQVCNESNDDVINQQTALISLKLICRRLPTSSDAAGQLFSIVDKCFKAQDKLPDVITGAALLLFAELCYSHPTRMLSHFSKLMKRFLAISEKHDKSEAIILGLVASYHRLVESLTGFLSPYLAKVVIHVCRLCAEQELKHRDGVLREQLAKICAHIGEHVPLRVLLPAIEDCLAIQPVVNEHQLYLNNLLRIFKASIETSDRHVFDQQREIVQSLVLRLLHYREEAAAHGQMDAGRVTEAEEFIVDCVTTLSLKMSEMTFRPFITRVFIWATRSKSATDDGAVDVDRTATFFHLCCKLSETLKALFVLFAGQFIQLAVETLDSYRAFKSQRNDSTRLATVAWILGMLSNCFQYGGKSFVTPEMYKTVASAIVDEIEQTAECPESTYESRMLTRVAPALANLSVACLDADCKDLHNKVLFKTRNSSARIRFAALQIFAAMVRRLGDDYVPLLPESVPFLAELMEDESTDVEQLTQEVVQEMEQLLGEPLMKYF